jgi:NADPH-dependent 2,4-dienoyl-CoA reductase/sulfur reductase-like enzyme
MTYDVIVIGAGPAGLTAATQAAQSGLRVALLDEQPNAGGQIYRDVDRASQSRGDILGRDFAYGLTLTQAMANSGVTHLRGAVVWSIENEYDVLYTQSGRAQRINARYIILATGAIERPMPITGWTLPGVMTAGAGQILLKQSGIVAQGAVLVGSGPLLYLLATQMIRAGTPPQAMIETQQRGDFIQPLSHYMGALRGWPYLVKGLGMLWEIKRAGVPRYTSARDIEITGDTHATGITFRAGRTAHTLDCQTVYLHHGVVPNTQIARSLDIPHVWDETQGCFAPKCDDWGQTQRDGIFIAGDSAGIGGAKVAEIAGHLCALKIAQLSGQQSPEQLTRQTDPLFRQLARERAARPFLDRAYPPYAPALLPSDDTIICRCEEVTAGKIRDYARMGCLGPNQAKAFGRAGMGPCQGRYCGLTVTQILADENNQTPDDTGYYRIRPPLKPVTLGELALMDTDPE